MGEKIIDVDDIIRGWARNWFERFEKSSLEKKFGKLNWDTLHVVVDRSNLHIDHELPEDVGRGTLGSGPDTLAIQEKEVVKEVVAECFSAVPDVTLGLEGASRACHMTVERAENAPRYLTLVKTSYINNTSSNQQYTFRTERRTKAFCTFALNSGFKFGSAFELRVSLPPKNWLEGKKSFTGEVSLNTSSQSTTEQELVWSVDSVVTVKPGCRTVAEMVVREQEDRMTLRMRSYFSGSVRVEVWKNDNLLIPLEGRNLTQILTKERGFERDKDGRIYVDSTGDCYCRFMLEQDIRLTEDKL